MILAVATALAGGLTASIAPATFTVGDCFELEVTIHNPTSEPQDVALTARAVTLTVSGRPPKNLQTTPEQEPCLGDGPRQVLAPGDSLTWTYRRERLLLPPGSNPLQFAHAELGLLAGTVEVVMDERYTPAYWARTRQRPPRGQFAHPMYVESLTKLARQGLVWAARDLLELQGEPGVATVLEELREHPLREIRAVVTPRQYRPPPGDLIDRWLARLPDYDCSVRELQKAGLLEGELDPRLAELAQMPELDAELLLKRIATSPPLRPGGDTTRSNLRCFYRAAPPLSTERLVEVLRTTDSVAVAETVVFTLFDRRDAAALPTMYDRLERCESGSMLIRIRGWAFERDERHLVSPRVARCLKSAATERAAVHGLLHLVAWGLERGTCGPYDKDAAIAAWSHVFDLHQQAIAAGRELPTYAEGVPEAARSLGCPVTPRSG